MPSLEGSWRDWACETKATPFLSSAFRDKLPINFKHRQFVVLLKFPVKISVKPQLLKYFFYLSVLDIAKAFLSSNSSAPKKNLLSETPVAVFSLIQVVCHKIFVAFQNNIHSIFNVLFKKPFF